MVDKERLQSLLDKANILDVKIRTLRAVPGADKFMEEIESLEGKVVDLKRRITLSAMVDMNPDLPGGSVPPENSGPEIDLEI